MAGPPPAAVLATAVDHRELEMGTKFDNQAALSQLLAHSRKSLT